MQQMTIIIINIIFFFFPEKQVLTFHMNHLPSRWFIWNVKACFLWKMKKQLECHLLQILLGTLTITTLLANSADNKLVIFFWFFPDSGIQDITAQTNWWYFLGKLELSEDLIVASLQRYQRRNIHSVEIFLITRYIIVRHDNLAM